MKKDLNDNPLASNGESITDWIQSFFIAVIIAFIIKTFVFSSTLVMGESMLPTLHEKDRLFVNKISTIFNNYERGDIVVLKAPDEESKMYIKRIIGVAGDNVEIKNGKVILNGEILDEKYVGDEKYTYTHNAETESVWKVPDETVFVLGDNREEWASKDSRMLGYIPISLLDGKVNYRYFPFSKASIVKQKRMWMY